MNGQLLILIKVYISLIIIGLWSPNTSVVNPKEILFELQSHLTKRKVKFIFGQ